MKPENYVAFFTVCGFFIGLCFSIISIEGAFDIVLFTGLITFIFYVIIHISIMNFVDVYKINGRSFNKLQYEEINDALISELAMREKKMDYLLEKLSEEREELKKNDTKERRKNAKRAA